MYARGMCHATTASEPKALPQHSASSPFQPRKRRPSVNTDTETEAEPWTEFLLWGLVAVMCKYNVVASFSQLERPRWAKQRRRILCLQMGSCSAHHSLAT